MGTKFRESDFIFRFNRKKILPLIVACKIGPVSSLLYTAPRRQGWASGSNLGVRKEDVCRGRRRLSERVKKVQGEDSLCGWLAYVQRRSGRVHTGLVDGDKDTSPRRDTAEVVT